MTNANTHVMTVRFDPELAKRVTARANETDRTTAALIRVACRYYLNDQKPPVFSGKSSKPKS
jgi:predicted transcriptional regulator